MKRNQKGETWRALGCSMHNTAPQQMTGIVGAAAAPARRRLPQIDAQRCTGCGRCVGACAPQVLSLEVQHWRKFSALSNAERCTGCSLCMLRCPFDAISMVKPESGPAPEPGPG